MAFFDFPLDQLRTYRPERAEPADFDAFWKSTLAETAAAPLEARFERVDTGLRLQEFFDVTFMGFGGQPVKGWLVLPYERPGYLPCIVEFIGYGGGRGFATDWLLWASAGYAHFIMDTRGQGSSWSRGDTPDQQASGDPSYPGFMTQGILDPHAYYYRRVFADAARAIQAAQSHPAVDANKIAVTGGSQGGGITLAAAALAPSVAAAMPDVPFLCHYRRATEIVDTYPYEEISRYLNTHRDRVDQVFHTLSYFDGVNFAARTHAKALFSVGLMDTICPPSTVYAAYNHYAGPKEMCEYTYNNHEGGGNYHTQEKLRFIRSLWG